MQPRGPKQSRRPEPVSGEGPRRGGGAPTPLSLRTAMHWSRVVAAMTVAVPLVMMPVAHAQDVGSATVVPIQITGDPAKRFSMVVMGDGYTAADMPKYRAHLDKHLNILWSIEPFRSYRSYINVYSVEIVSGESGITCDPEVRLQKKTPLGMQF